MFCTQYTRYCRLLYKGTNKSFNDISVLLSKDTDIFLNPINDSVQQFLPALGNLVFIFRKLYCWLNIFELHSKFRGHT